MVPSGCGCAVAFAGSSPGPTDAVVAVTGGHACLRPADTWLVVLVPSGSYRYTVIPFASTRIDLPNLALDVADNVGEPPAVADVDAVTEAVDADDEELDELLGVLDAFELEDELPQAAVPRTASMNRM